VATSTSVYVIMTAYNPFVINTECMKHTGFDTQEQCRLQSVEIEAKYLSSTLLLVLSRLANNEQHSFKKLSHILTKPRPRWTLEGNLRDIVNAKKTTFVIMVNEEDDATILVVLKTDIFRRSEKRGREKLLENMCQHGPLPHAMIIGNVVDSERRWLCR
jgi:hypothetical protein